MPFNVNMESLRKMHGDKAEDAFREIADKGGYGEVGTGQGQIDPNYPGGLDIQGALNEGNKAISSKDKDRIAELAGVTRDQSDNFKTTSSAGKKQPSGE